MIETPPNLAVQVIANARKYDTGQSLETLGNNDGPEIRDWLSRRGIHTPASWCAAFACAMIQDAARMLSLTLQMRYSAGALRLLDLNPDLRLYEPEVGCLEIEDHGHGTGHVRIVTGLTLINGAIAGLTAIAGNTSADGVSRNGDRVAERPSMYPNPRLAGYLRVV